ncbi:uncharacterized protein LOC133896844 [Phragmites australis]|uniref:uncharacterized protein LOC133896844 n=1 Tax=Phragmites australis TaxID=29695 RepID=UPI002D79E91A|nr:uncharacterized protein LOC133896844 [Phragmites australis]
MAGGFYSELSTKTAFNGGERKGEGYVHAAEVIRGEEMNGEAVNEIGSDDVEAGRRADGGRRRRAIGFEARRAALARGLAGPHGSESGALAQNSSRPARPVGRHGEREVGSPRGREGKGEEGGFGPREKEDFGSRAFS